MEKAATHIPAGACDIPSGIPVREIISARNHQLHGYLSVDDEYLEH